MFVDRMIGEILNLTRERIRQVEVLGLEKLRAVYDDLEGSTDTDESDD